MQEERYIPKMNENQNALSQKAVEAATILKERYPSDESMLDYTDAWQLLVAVALSAQTTDAQVNRVSGPLFARWPGPAELASADILDIEEMVHSTGFYRSKAKNIRAAAQHVLEYHDGRVPEDMDLLIKIPGIGRKSAGVILHHIYDRPAIIVDTHFGRVCARLGLLSVDPREKKPDPLKTEREISATLPEELWSSFSMSANLHGRAICIARAPKCNECFLAHICAYPKIQNTQGSGKGDA